MADDDNMELQFGRLLEVKEVKVADLAVGDRFIEPTEAEIEAMMKSLKRFGQLSPIVVAPITMSTYRVVAGATRLKAASKLNWDRVRVHVMSGSPAQCRIVELFENLDRRD